jgi:hypothetical protein
VKIRLLTARAGQGFGQNAGEEIDLPGAEAMRLVASGQAEVIREAPEAAVIPPAENAMRPAPRGRKRGVHAYGH